MTLTAPINIETQLDDIEIIEDAIHVVESPGSDTIVTGVASEPLLPFLALGVCSFIAILVTAILLAF